MMSEILVTVSGLCGTGKSAIAGEIEIALKAIGVPVVWEDSQSEKNLTHADWQSAIDMYQPRVTIREVLTASIPPGSFGGDTLSQSRAP
jgi:uridine kinase